MHAHPCPGLTADWLNGWLAALGITILLPDVRLCWTTGPAPHAIVQSIDSSPLAIQLANVFPTADDLSRFAVTEHAAEPVITGQNWTNDDYASRAAYARRHGDYSLGACYTDLAVDGRDPERATTAKSPFNVGAQGANPIGKRLRDCLAAVGEPLTDQIASTLAGHGRRVEVNGLGFDYRRLTVSGPRADPVVEILAFHGLAYLPIHGQGSSRAAARGWMGRPARFTWIAWTEPLGGAAIDALLDHHWSNRRAGIIHAIYASRNYSGKGDKDATRGYASERIWP